ncbi:MAG: cobalamin B12-binding domain-containing protein [Peptococcaceae bacterium]|jgi:methylmalonyl-CoA mutase C-terminal domain/subunit|nr:MAG: cobalamin B12-binding domain-containing protein [Peptococcaceae bacterium]
MNPQKRSIKVVVAKPGFDGHWRGAMIVSMALRDAGMEVVYMGNQTPAAIVESALQEDVDVIGLSILAAGHMMLISEVLDLLKEKNIRDILLIVGGTIPQEDIPVLESMGVHRVFPPGSKIEDIVDYVEKNGRAVKGRI